MAQALPFGDAAASMPCPSAATTPTAQSLLSRLPARSTSPQAGVSNVMAAHMISVSGKEYAADGSYAAEPGAGAARPKRVLYSYFTAGRLAGWLISWVADGHGCVGGCGGGQGWGGWSGLGGVLLHSALPCRHLGGLSTQCSWQCTQLHNLPQHQQQQL